MQGFTFDVDYKFNCKMMEGISFRKKFGPIDWGFTLLDKKLITLRKVLAA